MRSRTAQWFECKIKYEKVMEDGLQKQVVEQYAVDALSFAEAEQRITEEMSQYISGEFEVVDVKKAAYKEVFFDDDNAASDRWYRAKLDFITIDEKTEKEKRSRVTYLVQATNLNRAMKNVDTVMGGTMNDYDAASISDTKLVDVFESAADKAAELMARMAEDVKDASLKVEDIVDRYAKTATPELRQQLIDKLTEIRKEKFGIE
ncbi:MAG: DUF4494 domain-containing protein [Prevotella sp.]|nr:DUF4494 domain-containing protein [Prevotella sp.]